METIKICESVLKEKYSIEVKKEEYSNLEDVVELCNENFLMDKLDHEKLLLIGMKRNRIVDIFEIACGGIDYINVSMKTLLKYCILSNAQEFILIHNHPSGSTKTSEADSLLTKKLVNMLKSINMNLIDHIIIAENDYVSIRKEDSEIFSKIRLINNKYTTEDLNTIYILKNKPINEISRSFIIKAVTSKSEMILRKSGKGKINKCEFINFDLKEIELHSDKYKEAKKLIRDNYEIYSTDIDSIAFLGDKHLIEGLSEIFNK